MNEIYLHDETSRHQQQNSKTTTTSTTVIAKIAQIQNKNQVVESSSSSLKDINQTLVKKRRDIDQEDEDDNANDENDDTIDTKEKSKGNEKALNLIDNTKSPQRNRRKLFKSNNNANDTIENSEANESVSRSKSSSSSSSSSSSAAIVTHIEEYNEMNDHDGELLNLNEKVFDDDEQGHEHEHEEEEDSSRKYSEFFETIVKLESPPLDEQTSLNKNYYFCLTCREQFFTSNDFVQHCKFSLLKSITNQRRSHHNYIHTAHSGKINFESHLKIVY
jgi:hypothetical protein